MRPDQLVGRTLGDFVLRERLGEGGFGVVYRASQPLLDREAVIKVLHAPLRGKRVLTERFLREARLASKLDHPYAAHIYAFGAETDGELWIAMELVRGTPLDRLLETSGPIGLERFVPLFERMCEVVHTAHEQGIVHRDIKPANVMVLSRAGRLLPKLLDFGIAKALDAPADPSAEPTVDMSPETAPPEVLGAARTLAAPAPAGLTQRGAVMGSPPYMAPEQWLDATAVDARTDLYALAILAYEAIAGRLPFTGATLTAFAQAHARTPPPPLGDGLPRALDAVFATALAKRPEDRFASALVMAEAFRAASGIGEKRPTLPMLEDAVRERVFAEAPHPIAEAVAALEAARNAHQARDALHQLTRTVVRYLGLLAIAARTRIGSKDGDAAPVTEALRALYRGGLSDARWLELARDIVRAHVDRRDAFPLPELIDVFFDRGGAPAATATRLELLIGLREPSAALAGGDEPKLIELLDRGCAEASRVLRDLTLLYDYSLVVTITGGLAERWMGVRRGQRATMAVAGKTVQPGVPVLVDRDAVPVLTLAPLVQIHAPSPGAPVDLFVFEGRGRQGAKLVALPLGFEHHDESLWDWYRAQLSGSLDEAAASAADERAPYRGLSAFAPEDAALFFGREKLVDAFLNRLRVQPLLAVVGRSGAGKSSFVQAGVIPALAADWRALVVRPGFAPFAALAARLHHAGFAVDELRAGAPDPGALGRVLRADAARRGPVLLVIDQLEELFTLCTDEDERRRFAEAIAAAAHSADDPVRVVFTLRDDFLVRAEQVPALRNRIAQGLQLLTVPVADDLLRILVEPARRAGYDFEDAELPAEMVREVADQPGALALVSFTALKLWEARDRHFRQLTRKAYRSLGGVGGALAQHAEKTLEEMPPEARRLTREAFRHLVTSQNTRAVVPRAELIQLLGSGAPAEQVIESLIGARLLVASESEAGDDDVEIVHEALLSAWPRLVAWRGEDQEGARFREQLRSAARQWDERGRPRGLVWRGDALAELHVWRAKHDKPLTPAEDAFVATSTADAARGRRVRRTLVGVAFAALATAVVVFLQISRQEKAQRVNAATERQRAESLLVTSWEDQGTRLVLDGDSLGGLAFLNAALQAGRDSDVVRYSLARAFRTIDAELATFAGHVGAVWTVAFSPDGALLASGADDGKVVVWDVARRAKRHELAHGAIVRAVAFVAGGRLVSGGNDGVVRVWRADTGALERTLGTPGGGGIVGLRTDATGTTLLAISFNTGATLWDIATGALIRTLPFDNGGMAADLAADATLAVVAKGVRGAELWDLSRNLRIATITSPNSDPNARWLFLRLGPRRDRILSIGWDEPARLWDAADGRLVATLDGATGNRNFGEFSPDGTQVVTTGAEDTVKTWDATTGGLIATMRGHTGAVNMVAYASGGTVASGALDGVVRFWDADTGVALAAHTGHDRPVSALATHGDLVASGGWDGSARLYERTTGDMLASTEVSRATLDKLALSHDDRTAAVGGLDGRAVLIDVATGAPIGAPHVHAGPVRNTGIVVDGSWVSAGADGTVFVTSPGGAPIGFAAGAPIASLATHPREARLAIYRSTGRLEIWDLTRRALVAERAVRATESAQVEFAPDGKRVAYYGMGEPPPMTFWDWATNGTQEAAELGLLVHVGFNSDGRVAVATMTGIAVLDADGRRVASTELAGARPYHVAFNGDTILAACEDGLVRILDARGAVTGLLRGHAATVLWSGFVPDTNLVVSAGADSTLRLWNATNLAPLAVLDAHGPVMLAALSSTGTRLVSAEMDGRFTVWQLPRDTRSRAEIREAVRCRVPRRLEEGRIIAATLPTDCH